MRVHLVNPSDVAFGVGVITPRWLYVLAASTPAQYGDPAIVDETLEAIRPDDIQPGDVVGVGIHTANALRGFEVGRLARERGACVVFGGIHATLYPAEAQEHGAAHAVVQGDGDVIWATVLADCLNGAPKPLYDGGRVSAGRSFPPAGTCFHRTATCGRPSRPCAAAPSTARSVRCGEPMASNPASAPATP